MKTEGEIKKRLEVLKYNQQYFRAEDQKRKFESWINALEWVLEND